MMTAIAAIARLVDAVNGLIGRFAALLILVTVLVCAFVALSRYLFGFGRIWVQEIYVVAFGISFMLMAPWAYARNDHVRVDILAKGWSPRTVAWIEIGGVLVFLVPWLLLLLWSATPFIRLSWSVLEPSTQAGGLPGFFLIKTVIPVFAVLMLLQGLGAICRSILVLGRREELLPPLALRH
jgi:TRAP-type mannitol/chloroaromatic compound transport system permease small subunit